MSGPPKWFLDGKAPPGWRKVMEETRDQSQYVPFTAEARAAHGDAGPRLLVRTTRRDYCKDCKP